MKFIKKALAVLLCFTVLFSCACAKKQNAPVSEPEAAKIPLILDGQSKYSILIGNEASEEEVFAAEELSLFLGEASGYSMRIVRDSEREKNGKYISVGYTDLLSETGITADADKLKKSGYRIVSDGGNVFVFGAQNVGDGGTVYGVYGFLNDTIGYVYYSDLTIYYEKSTKVYMKETYDITEIPTFDIRFVSTFDSNYDYNYMMRMRFTDKSYKSEVLTGHSHFIILPWEEYLEDHPDWYTPKGTGTWVDDHPSQICLSNEEMIQQFGKNLIEFVKAEPDKTEFDISLMDYLNGCACEKCAENSKKYGTYGGLNCVFMNKVTDICDAWLEENQPWRKITYSTYAYHATRFAPVKKNEQTGEWEPFCDEVVLKDNILLRVALIQTVINKPLDHPSNKIYYESLQGWSVIAKNIMNYRYGTNYVEDGFMYSINDFDTFERNFRIDEECNVIDSFLTYVYHTTNMACMYDLKAYCISQLMWNNDLSFEELANDFIEKSYDVAAPYIKEYVDLYRSWIAYYEDSQEIEYDASADGLYNNARLPKKLMDKLVDLVEQGYAAIEEYKTSDPEKYENLKDKLDKEMVMPFYARLRLYSSSYSNEKKVEMLDELQRITLKFNILLHDQGKTIMNKIIAWRDALEN